LPLRYQSGEEIKKGDRVLFRGKPGEIELVADPEGEINDTKDGWHLREIGPGVLIRAPKNFGRVFIRPQGNPQGHEDGDWASLSFVSRQS